MDPAALAAGQRAFQERMARWAAQPLPAENLLRPYQQHLLAQAARIANNLGVLQAVQRRDGGLETFRAALRIDPGNLSAWMNLADLLRRLGSPELVPMEAEWDSRLDKAWPSRWGLSFRHGYLWNARAWVQRGHVWALSGQPEASAGHRRTPPPVDLSAVAREQIFELIYGRRGLFGGDLMLHGRLMRYERDTTALLALGRLALRRNDREAAEAYLTEALAAGMGEASVAFERAMAVYTRDGHEPALLALQNVVRENPADLRAWLALALLAKAGSATGREALRNVQNLRSEDGGGHYVTAWLQMQRSQWDAAQTELEAAVRAAPKSVKAWELLLVLSQIRENRRWLQTSRRTLLELDPEHPLQVVQAVSTLMENHEEQAAAERIRAGLARDRHPDLLHALASILLDTGGDPVEARALLEEARVRMPFHPVYACAMAGLDIREGRLEDAEQELRSVLASIPRHAWALWLLARVHVIRGEIEPARSILRTLDERRRELSPDLRAKLKQLEQEVRP
jgi:tetratricopeptide (TPR) repeat protein